MIKKNKTNSKTKMNIRKGDTVVVISGKDKGKKGKVLRAVPKDKRVIVEKVNFISKHSRPTQQNQKGGIIKREAPIHVSNVKLFNEKINDVTRAIYKDAGDSRVRVCKKTGDEI